MIDAGRVVTELVAVQHLAAGILLNFYFAVRIILMSVLRGVGGYFFLPFCC